jgi:hypothetical protein
MNTDKHGFRKRSSSATEDTEFTEDFAFCLRALRGEIVSFNKKNGFPPSRE